MLKIKNLFAKTEDKEILKGLNLEIKPGEVHAVMGPNGSGKSTLSKVIAGHPSYEVQSGQIEYEINFEWRSLLDFTPDQRAKEGIFLAFQYPMEIRGVSNIHFLREAFNSQCRYHGSQEMSEDDFQTYLFKKAEVVKMNPSFLTRGVNEGFSGGEKKRNEILQMAVLNPRLMILDEIDSGLDIDALKIVSEGVNRLRTQKNSFLMVTHYQRLLEFIKPDFVHVLSQGKIIKTGDFSLALELEDKGYDWISI